MYRIVVLILFTLSGCNDTMALMNSKSHLVEKMVAASFLHEPTKRNYLQSYQGRLNQLIKV